jgi:Ca-activated chloride channel family protein
MKMMNHWFAYPLALMLFSVLPMLGSFVLWGWLRRRQGLARFGTLTMLETVLTVRRWPRFLRGLCGFLGTLCLLAGIAGPQWGRDWKQATAPGRDLIVVLDCSRSMLAESPSRFERARTFAADLADAVQKRGGHRLGLVVFAGRAKLVCPLTHDYDYFRETLRALDPQTFDLELAPGPGDESGTRIGAALALAVRSHDERFRGARDLMLLSDGDDPLRDGEWKRGAGLAKAQGIPVLVVGVGDPNKASTIPLDKDVLRDDKGKEVLTRLEEAPLREIAATTKGAYVPAQTQHVAAGPVYLDAIASLPVHESEEDALPAYRQHNALFYLPALALFALAMLVPDRLPRLRSHIMRLLTRLRPTATGGTVMKRSQPAVAAAALVALVFLGAASITDPQSLLKEGDAAAARGDYAAAVELYRKAEPRTTEPVEVAYRLGVVKYQLAVEAGGGRDLFEAEELFRCCVGRGNPRRAACLFGLGNCLLLKARGKNLELARAAVEAYEQCLQEPGLSAEFTADARHNLERAKLVTLQLLAPATRPEDKNSTEPPPDPDPDPKNPPNTGRHDSNPPSGTDPKNSGKPDPNGTPQPVKPDPGQTPIQVPETAPGVGNLSPIPDVADPQPVPPKEALSHLESATQRILQERQAYRLQKTRPVVPGVRDW